MPAIPVSARARAISDSVTLAIQARAKAMRAEGVDVVSLGAGEPDFDTPENIQDAGVQAIRDGHTRYTAVSGMPELRTAAAKWFNRHFDLDYSKEEIIVTAGAKPALSLGLTAVLNDGDRVLLPAPFWPSYPDIVRIAGGVPVPLEAVPEQGFVHTPDQLAKAFAETGAKGVMFNYPNNPSGAIATREQVEGLLKVCIDHNAWIVSDEIYARLLYDGAKHVSFAALDGGKERTMIVNGGTKSHSMTGWRVGFLAAPKEIAAAVGRIQGQAIGNTCTISQHAAITVCEETDNTELERRLETYDGRRRLMVERVSAIDGLAVNLPQGAFYAMVDCRPVCQRAGINDIEFCERLLIEGKVATVPGTAFELPGFLRLSYAASTDAIETAIDRLGTFVKSL
ncbi:MAG: pyridoxal phosphate-dependent aminotransferase [Planctomycetota bacterium]